MAMSVLFKRENLRFVLMNVITWSNLSPFFSEIMVVNRLRVLLHAGPAPPVTKGSFTYYVITKGGFEMITLM